MVHIQYNEALLSTLKDRVVVLTGGATGIGRATVKLFNEHGAKICFGDISDPAAEGLLKELNSPNVLYQHCDTTSYQDQLSLFKKAEKEFGPIDIVIANAGVVNPRDPFAKDADVEKEFSTREIDVNLRGHLFTTRIGLAFLRKNKEVKKGARGGDLVLVSSIAGWKECTGLVTYTASKHGVIGIMRGLNLSVKEEGIRMNVICPWMTKTGMVTGIETGWEALSLPVNQPGDVSKSIAICCTAGRTLPSHPSEKHAGAVSPFEGKIVWVSGGEAYEIEDAIQSLEPKWLGEENAAVLAKGQAFLMSDTTSWDTGK